MWFTKHTEKTTDNNILVYILLGVTGEFCQLP